METKTAVDAILKKINDGIESYSNILKQNKLNYHCIDIDCSTLTEPVTREKDGRTTTPPFPFYAGLPADNIPCLYYFEFNPADRDNILKEYRAFLIKQQSAPPGTFRRGAALKKKLPQGTSVLYVGKRKREIGGRLVVHLGYYDVSTTGGLQLRYWAKKIGLKLKFHVFWFEPEMRDFIDPLEIALSRKMKPLIGML